MLKLRLLPERKKTPPQLALQLLLPMNPLFLMTLSLPLQPQLMPSAHSGWLQRKVQEQSEVIEFNKCISHKKDIRHKRKHKGRKEN